MGIENLGDAGLVIVVLAVVALCVVVAFWRLWR
jgi:hypothetical protein